MKAVIYARYSSERQTEQSIEGQIRECKEFAEAEGITIIDSYIDRAISGKTDIIVQNCHKKFGVVCVKNVAKGKTTGGGVALGYKIGADKRLEIDTDTAPIVQKIFDMYSTGSSFAAIITALNDAGYKTSRGNDYNKCSIQRILKNRKYIGVYIVKNISEVSECPAIISREQFEAVQVRLSEASHKRKHRNEHSYFLTWKLRCAACGKPVTGTSGTSKTGKRYFYYKCANLCTSITQDKLENIVLNLLVDYLTPEKIYQISKATYECYKKEQASNTEQEALKNQISIIEKKINNIINAIMNSSCALEPLFTPPPA